MDIETVRNVAKLARLELSDEELQTFCNDLNDILEYLSMLDEAPDVECFGFNPIPVADVLREDEVGYDVDVDSLREMLTTYQGWVRGPRLS